MKSPAFPNEKENSILHPNDQLRRKLADLTSDSSFSSDLSNKFLKSLIKKKSLPVFLSAGTQTEEILLLGSQELEVLKDKNRKLEQSIATFQADIDKLRFENLKLEKTIKNLQESLAARGQNQNNTSSSFSLPSELKNNWDILIKELISGLFCGFIENPLVYVNLIQDLLKLIEDLTEKQISNKTDFLTQSLNLSAHRESVYRTLLLLFQDYHSTIFSLQPGDMDSIKTEFKQMVESAVNCNYQSFERNSENERGKLVDGNKEDEIKDLLENEDLEKLIGLYHSICMYMKLSDPPLKSGLSSFASRTFTYVLFKKSEYNCIDGFVKENSLAIVAVPSIRRGTHVFNGMRAGVLILGKEFTEKQDIAAIWEKLRADEKNKEKKEEISEIIQVKEEQTKANEEIMQIKVEVCENKEINEEKMMPSIDKNDENKEISFEKKNEAVKTTEANETTMKIEECPKENKENSFGGTQVVGNNLETSIKLARFQELSQKLFIKSKTFNHISYTERGEYQKSKDGSTELLPKNQESSPRSSRSNLRASKEPENPNKLPCNKFSQHKKWSPVELKNGFMITNNNKNLLKEVLEIKNYRKTLANFKESVNKKGLSTQLVGKKKNVSDLSETSSSFSDYQCEKKNNKFHSITHISSIKPAKNVAPDLPRDKESFNKRKNLDEGRKTPSVEDRNVGKESNTIYYFGQNRRKNDNKSRLEVFLKEDLKNTIISLKNSIDIGRQSENNTLKQKWREAQEKSLERVGKIVNQSNKLKISSNETSQFLDEITEKAKPKINNFIADDAKPALIRKKPNNSFVSSGSASFNNQNNQTNNNNANQKSLAEKLKKEILSMNESENPCSSYILSTQNRKSIENRSFLISKQEKNPENKEKRSISMRRTLNSLLETLSSEEEEEKKCHFQRKSLNPAANEGNLSKNMRKDIEKIYKEYKSRKI